MSKPNFAELVKTYLKAAGYSQKILANELGVNSSALNHKLKGTGRFILTYPEIRDIVRMEGYQETRPQTYVHRVE
jgi:transcriptional regulator with XRE-family HTH domain